MNRTQADSFIISHEFAGFVIQTKGLGIYHMSDRNKALIRAMSKEQAKQVNQAAWKVCKEQVRIIDRSCNASIPGNLDKHDIATMRHEVAEKVKKETYKIMIGCI